MSEPDPTVFLVRHGQTPWSRDGKHTGRTDVALTPEGEDQARALVPVIGDLRIDLVLCSPLSRARRTAELAGLEPYRISDDLQEWDYGSFEGRTTAEIHEDLPDWSIWDGPWQGGETAADVSARADRLITAVRGAGAARVALVGHGHFSRVIASRWVGEEVEFGRRLDLDTATWSELGWDRGTPVIGHWNVPAPSKAPG